MKPFPIRAFFLVIIGIAWAVMVVSCEEEEVENQVTSTYYNLATSDCPQDVHEAKRIWLRRHFMYDSLEEDEDRSRVDWGGPAGPHEDPFVKAKGYISGVRRSELSPGTYRYVLTLVEQNQHGCTEVVGHEVESGLPPV